MAHAEKPPPGDSEMFVLLAIAFGVFTSLYVFFHNWIALLVSMLQCGQEC
jgi:hypothetical protein